MYDNTELVVIHQLINDERKKIELPEHAIEKLEYSLGASSTKIKQMAENNLKEIGEIYK